MSSTEGVEDADLTATADLGQHEVGDRQPGNEVVAGGKRLRLARRPDREIPRTGRLVDRHVQGDTAGAGRHRRRPAGHRQVDRRSSGNRDSRAEASVEQTIWRDRGEQPTTRRWRRGVVADDIGDQLCVALGVVEVDATVGTQLDGHQVRHGLTGDVVQVGDGRYRFARRPRRDEARCERGVDGHVQHNSSGAERHPADTGDLQLGCRLAAERRDVATGAVACIEQSSRVQRHVEASCRRHRPFDAHRPGGICRALRVVAARHPDPHVVRPVRQTAAIPLQCVDPRRDRHRADRSGGVPAPRIRGCEELGGSAGGGGERDRIFPRGERGVVGQADVAQREVPKSPVLGGVESTLGDADAAPAGLVDGVLVVHRAGWIGGQVDGHHVAARVDDDVLRFAPDLSALVEPRESTDHSAAGCVGKAEAAAVTDVDRGAVIPVGDQRRAQWQFDERIVAERRAVVAGAVEVPIRDVADGHDIVGRGHVPGVARHGCVVGAAHITRSQHLDDRRTFRRNGGVGTSQPCPIELHGESIDSAE